jgi:hypothetical protein
MMYLNILLCLGTSDLGYEIAHAGQEVSLG